MYITTRDGDRLAVSRSVIELNTFLNVMVEDNDEFDISLSMVTTKDMAKVIEFCNYYDRNPFVPIERPVRHRKMDRVVEDRWYINFVELGREDLFDMINVANYLDNQPLLDLLCAKIATMVRGKTVSEVREMLL